MLKITHKNSDLFRFFPLSTGVSPSSPALVAALHCRWIHPAWLLIRFALPNNPGKQNQHTSPLLKSFVFDRKNGESSDTMRKSDFFFYAMRCKRVKCKVSWSQRNTSLTDTGKTSLTSVLLVFLDNCNLNVWISDKSTLHVQPLTLMWSEMISSIADSV